MVSVIGGDRILVSWSLGQRVVGGEDGKWELIGATEWRLLWGGRRHVIHKSQR